MRRWVTLVVLLGACSSIPADTTMTSTTTPVLDTSSTSSTSTTLPEVDVDLAPDFTLELGDGGSFTLSATDRPVYLLFWAEWCPVCRKELPMIDRLAGEYADRIHFVAPVWKSAEADTRRTVEEFFHSGRIQWGFDTPQTIFRLYGVPYQPVTVLIAKDRTVIDSWAGVRLESTIRSQLEELIADSG